MLSLLMDFLSVSLGSDWYSLFFSLVPKGYKASLASVYLYMPVHLFQSVNF